jgi:outer membrane protein OmpA-like peptidoglycan-associated protein
MRFKPLFRTGLALLTITSLAGCATNGSMSPGACAALGAGVGAVGGGVGGGLYSANNTDRDHNGWEGAGIALASTAVGAGVGYLVCSLMEEEPKPEPVRHAQPAPPPKPAPAPPPPAPKEPDVCKEMVRIHDIKFENAKAVIQPNASTVLDQTAGALQHCPDVRVRLDAYTDSNGSDAYNMKLSQRRADAVRDYLVAHGVSASRIEAHGLGESNPIGDNKTAEGRAENRRVEIAPLH